jgi:hypothetical protein
MSTSALPGCEKYPLETFMLVLRPMKLALMRVRRELPGRDLPMMSLQEAAGMVSSPLNLPNTTPEQRLTSLQALRQALSEVVVTVVEREVGLMRAGVLTPSGMKLYSPEPISAALTEEARLVEDSSLKATLQLLKRAGGMVWQGSGNRESVP